MKLYRYDEFNRLIKYNDDGTEAKYTYGVDNLRATKTVNGTTTSYVWNGQNLASETKDNTTTVYYYDSLGVNGAKTDNEIFTRYIKDPHGNVVATSKNSTLFGTYDYTAFGNQLEATDTTNPFRYCGEYYDEESGLTYLRNRYYNSTTGRFISEDPIRDELNWYAYVGNNPVALVDPLGLAKKTSSTVPGDLDWDGDGFMDTKSDRKRFDSNNNNIADWIEDGYETAEDWYVNKTYNIIPDFTLIEQEGDTCSFTSMGMIILQLTGQKISYRYMAENELENNKTKAELYSKWYEFGMGITDIKKHIVRNKYFQGSNYNVGKKYHNDYLTPDTFKFHCDMCGKCCINREDILLNAKDVFNIAKGLGVKPADVINQYCDMYIGGDSRFPIVRLQPNGSIKRCPFLKNHQCSIHKVKPTVCALFPLGRVVAYEMKPGKPDNIKPGEVNYIFQNPGCGDDSETHTVKDWLGDFDIPFEDAFFKSWQSHLAEFSRFVRWYEKKNKKAEKILEKIWEIMFITIYLNYDTDKDFMSQYTDNMEALKGMLEPFGLQRRYTK